MGRLRDQLTSIHSCALHDSPDGIPDVQVVVRRRKVCKMGNRYQDTDFLILSTDMTFVRGEDAVVYISGIPRFTRTEV